jgi:hypothetical protein
LYGAKKFDFTVKNDGEDVTLQTKVVMAKITGTLLDGDPWDADSGSSTVT